MTFEQFQEYEQEKCKCHGVNKNYVRYGRADIRCGNCGRQLMMELVFLHEAPINNPTK